MPRRPETHITDEKAQRLFMLGVPEEWVARRQEPDYGVDYQIEIFDDHNSTGELFAVQLKGTTSPNRVSGVIKFSLPVEHLLYYESFPLPVFLVVADVGSRTCYWLFVQEYTRHGLRGTDWRAQKEVTLSMPASQVWDGSRSLRRAVRQAISFMDALRPTAIDKAIEAEEARLESLDPRFGVRIKATADRQERSIYAKQPTELRWTLNPAVDPARVAELLNMGKKVKLAPGEAQVDSPLFEELMRSGGELQFAASYQMQLVLTPLSKRRRLEEEAVYLPCEVTRGKTWVEFEAKLPNAPLSVTFGHGLEFGDGKTKMHTRADWDCWKGQRLLQLSGFESMDVLLGAKAFDIDYIAEGKRRTLGRAAVESEDMFGYLKTIRWMRELARALGVDPVFPGELYDQQLDQAAALRKLATTGKLQTQEEMQSGELLSDSPMIIIDETRMVRGLSFVGEFSYPFEFLGERTLVVLKEYVLTKALLSSVGDGPKERGAKKISWRSGPGAKLTLRADLPLRRAPEGFKSRGRTLLPRGVIKVADSGDGGGPITPASELA